MGIKNKKLDNYRFYIIDKRSFLYLPIYFFILFFVFILLVNYVYWDKSTTFFAPFKIFFSSGISLGLIGGMLINSNLSSVDVFLKNNSSYLFTNHWSTSIIKLLFTSIGSILLILFYIFQPEEILLKSFWDYFTFCVSIFFGFGLIVAIISPIWELIQNKGDYILIENDHIEWFDDKNNETFELKFSEIKSMENREDILKIKVFSKNELVIDFKSMSLLPQMDFIIKKISEKTIS